MRKPYERWIVLPDAHLPYEDKRSLAAVEQYMKDVQKSRNPFVGWLQLGDLLDLDELSRFNSGYEASIEGNLERSFEAGNEFLDRHQALMMGNRKKRNYKMYLIQGNHDYRTVDFGKKYPHLSEHCNYEKNLSLKERGISYYKFWEDNREIVRLGKASFVHGVHINMYHAKYMAIRFGKCVFYGHTHDVHEHSVVFASDGNAVLGKSLGHLADTTKLKYLKNSITNWQHAFAEFFFFPDGTFHEVTHKIVNHKFVGLNGKVYKG